MCGPVEGEFGGGIAAVAFRVGIRAAVIRRDIVVAYAGGSCHVGPRAEYLPLLLRLKEPERAGLILQCCRIRGYRWIEEMPDNYIPIATFYLVSLYIG